MPVLRAMLGPLTLLLAALVHAGLALTASARRSAAPDNWGLLPGSSTAPDKPSRAPAARIAHASDAAGMFPVEPFEVPGATVHGPVSAHLQTQLLQRDASTDRDSGSLRTLLHGSHRLSRYSRCGKCRMLSCSRTRSFCTGHCRSRGRLRGCSSKNIPAAFCLEDYETTIDGPAVDGGAFVEGVQGGETAATAATDDRPPSSLDELDSVLVTVDAAMSIGVGMGCAEIAGEPNGCPPPGTRTGSTGKASLVLVNSTCLSQTYDPGCLGLLFPIGVCQCTFQIFANAANAEPVLSTGLCSTSAFTLPSRTDSISFEGGVEVIPGEEGAGVQTWIRDVRETGTQRPDSVLNVTVSAEGFNVTLSLFRPSLLDADYVDYSSEASEGEPVVYDYDYEYDAATNGQYYTGHVGYFDYSYSYNYK